MDGLEEMTPFNTALFGIYVRFLGCREKHTKTIGETLGVLCCSWSWPPLDRILGSAIARQKPETNMSNACSQGKDDNCQFF